MVGSPSCMLGGDPRAQGQAASDPETPRPLRTRSGEILSTSESLWTAVAEQLRSQLNDAVWLSTFAAVTTTASHDAAGALHVQLEVPSLVAKDRINTRYHSMVQDAFEEVCGHDTSFDVVVHVNDVGQLACIEVVA